MAKKSAPKKPAPAKAPATGTPRPSADAVERAITKALDQVPGLATLPEPEYLETCLDALDLIQTGLEMRKQELAGENDAE